MAYLFSSESVSEGHPDKVADQISDALLDQFLAYDDKAHCAIETFNTTGQVVIMGEVRSTEYVDLQTVARKTIDRIGYNKAEYQFDSKSCGILTAIHEQSEDIDRGVSREDEEVQGAGDQGMMFGYACNETANYMPVTLDLAHLIMRTLADIRKEGKQMTYLRPDSIATRVCHSASSPSSYRPSTTPSWTTTRQCLLRFRRMWRKYSCRGSRRRSSRSPSSHSSTTIYNIWSTPRASLSLVVLTATRA